MKQGILVPVPTVEGVLMPEPEPVTEGEIELAAVQLTFLRLVQDLEGLAGQYAEGGTEVYTGHQVAAALTELLVKTQREAKGMEEDVADALEEPEVGTVEVLATYQDWTARLTVDHPGGITAEQSRVIHTIETRLSVLLQMLVKGELSSTPSG